MYTNAKESNAHRHSGSISVSDDSSLRMVCIKEAKSRTNLSTTSKAQDILVSSRLRVWQCLQRISAIFMAPCACDLIRALSPPRGECLVVNEESIMCGSQACTHLSRHLNLEKERRMHHTGRHQEKGMRRRRTKG